MGGRQLERRELLSGVAGGSIGYVWVTETRRADTQTEGVERVQPPEPELSVQPGTTIVFEIGVDGIGEWPEWYLDGEFAGASMGPWESAYVDHRGTTFWQHTFESDRQVTAEIDGSDAITWTVDVASGGIGAPSITDTQPSTDDRLPRAPDETIELEVAVSDPDGNLDRVVWWALALDVVLDVTDVDGSDDTATLEVDADDVVPEGVLAWVLSENGAIDASDSWQFEQLTSFEIEEMEAESPVGGGETLEVDATIRNAGPRAASTDVELVVGHDPQIEDSEQVELEPDETTDLTLIFETGEPAGDSEEFPVAVDTGTDTASEMVVVEDELPATFEVTALSTNSPVSGGETLEVETTIENVGDETGTTDVELVVGHDPQVEDSELLTLEPDETANLTLTFETGEPAGDSEAFPVDVDTGADTASETVVVEEATPATFEVTSIATNSPIGGGETLEVETTIENVGDETGTTDVELVVGHDPQVEDSELLTLEPGESAGLTLTFQAGEPAGDSESFPVEVDTGADTASTTVVVESTVDVEDDELPDDDDDEPELPDDDEGDDQLPADDDEPDPPDDDDDLGPPDDDTDPGPPGDDTDPGPPNGNGDTGLPDDDTGVEPPDGNGGSDPPDDSAGTDLLDDDGTAPSADDDPAEEAEPSL